MSDFNHFTVREAADQPPAKKGPKKANRKIGRICLIAAAAAVVLAVVFAAAIPCFTVKKVATRTVETKQTDNHEVIVETFSDTGELTGRSYTLEGEPYREDTFEFEDGRVVQMQTSYFGQPYETTEYQYDGNRLTEKNTQSTSGISFLRVYEYDQKKVSRITVTSSDSNVVYTYDYEYEKNRPVRVTLSEPSLDYLLTYEFTYSKGRLVSLHETDNGHRDNTVTYTYNKRGEITKETRTGGSQYETEYTYTYRQSRVTLFGKLFAKNEGYECEPIEPVPMM